MNIIVKQIQSDDLTGKEPHDKIKSERRRETAKKLLVMNPMQRISSRDFPFRFSTLIVFSNHSSYVDVVDLL